LDPGPDWTDAESLALPSPLTAIRLLDLPARSESLYRVRIPAL